MFSEFEKNWHGLHFGLTGTSWDGDEPLNFLMRGKTVGDLYVDVDVEIDVGFGPARILDSDEIFKINNALLNFTEQDFDRNFNLAEMDIEEVYPQTWSESREDLLAEYLFFLNDLRKFLHAAAKNKQSIVMAVR